MRKTEIRRLAAGIVVGWLILAGCSTTTTTTGSLTFLHSPVRVSPTGHVSAFKVGASVEIEVDRGRTRAGVCGISGYEWTGEARIEVLASGAEAVQPINTVLGSYCYMQDLRDPADPN